MGRPDDLILSAVAEKGAALMGVLNTTPDSFYDGGRYDQVAAGIARVDALLEEGADIIDIGGESTRPGAEPVAAAEQLRRITPALEHAVARGACVSVDTTLPEVAAKALALGAEIVNDVSCLADPELARVAAHAGAPLIVMHSRGPMSNMAGFSQYPKDGYGDVVVDVLREWRAARDRALAVGMTEAHVWLDPGLGFAKNAEQSLTLLTRLSELSHGTPLVVGPSRKSFIAALDGAPPEERLGGTIAACLAAVARGASVLRVHDVSAVRQALGMSRALTPEVARA